MSSNTIRLLGNALPLLRDFQSHIITLELVLPDDILQTVCLFVLGTEIKYSDRWWMILFRFDQTYNKTFLSVNSDMATNVWTVLPFHVHD